MSMLLRSLDNGFIVGITLGELGNYLQSFHANRALISNLART